MESPPRAHRSRNLDHYYWLTAYLTARNWQLGSCRLIALVILGVGTVPATTLILSSARPMPWQIHVLGAGITACCLAMSTLWLRHRWPSRRQSQVCVVIGTLGTAAASLAQPQVLLGLLGSTAFIVLCAYCALFHSTRMLGSVWCVAAVTVVVLGIRLSFQDPILAIAAVILVVLVNVFVAFSSRVLIRLLDNDIHTDIEPLTGLLDRDGFYDRVATVIGARSRDDDRHLVMMVINVDNFSLLLAMTGDSGVDQVRVSVAQALRETLRRDAIAAHVGDAEFFIAELFTTADPSVLTDRVRGAIRTIGPAGMTTSIGAVSTPLGPLVGLPPYDVCSELLTIASAAMFDARRAGGNRSHQVLGPTLTVLDDPDDDLEAFG